MDDGAGEIVRTVKRLGLERMTFIFFCSDNGATGPGSNTPLRGKKGTMWEGGHRVPAIACWPGKIKSGMITDETAMTMDIFPTMVAAAGTTIPEGLNFDGVNLFPVLFAGKPLPERTLFWRRRGQKAVRKGPWKLVITKAKRKKKESEIELFNLKTDIGEQTNLKDIYPDKTRELTAELAKWEEEVTAGVKMRA